MLWCTSTGHVTFVHNAIVLYRHTVRIQLNIVDQSEPGLRSPTAPAAPGILPPPPLSAARAAGTLEAGTARMPRAVGVQVDI